MSAYRTTPVNELGMLIDGSNYYRELYRAMLAAERSIVLSGWQFDSGVALLRGKDAEGVETPITFLALLKHLCEQKPWLQVWILAWDFHPILVMEREWLQKVVFDWTIPDKLAFTYDSNHAPRGCHHQKFVTIDGELTFTGGLDIAEDRWDEPSHTLNNPRRISRGEPHKPFHDVHLFVRSREFTAAIHELFLSRWEQAGGVPFDPSLLAPAGTLSDLTLESDHFIPATRASIQRTDPQGRPGGPKPCSEIYETLVEGILSAERIIYAETQYFSSYGLRDALVKRMRDTSKGVLEIVFVLNPEGESLKEVIAMGLSQAQIIIELREVARMTGHHLGFYVTVPHCNESVEPGRTTYIHSKIMIIDDRWMCVGSANLNNRSMGVDTELNITVAGPELEDSLRKLRCSLLAHHMGGAEVPQIDGLVAKLNELIETKDTSACRLRFHPSPTENEATALSLLDPQQLPFDPDHVEPQAPDLVDQFARAFKQLFDSRADRG